jgi:hypothetical protein
MPLKRIPKSGCGCQMNTRARQTFSTHNRGNQPLQIH